ncbi:MAG: hypothetical protein ACRD0A_10195 [Acidimicrobiales bacterium]
MAPRPADWIRLNAALPPELHRRARATASLDGIDLQDLVVIAVEQHVERRERERAEAERRRRSRG